MSSSSGNATRALVVALCLDSVSPSHSVTTPETDAHLAEPPFAGADRGAFGAYIFDHIW